jgi:hypothetical protein
MGGGCGVELGYWHDGGSADRRVDMRAATSALPFRFDYPSVSLVNHFNDLGYNFIASFIKFIKDLLAQVAMPNSNLDVNLDLRSFRLGIVKLRNKSCQISPFSPRLGQVCANRARGSPDLISQCVAFVVWKVFRQFGNLHYDRHSPW